MSSVDLPPGDVAVVDLDVSADELSELGRRAERDELAPAGESALHRYVLYLGAAYREAEEIVEQAESWQEAFERLSSRFGAYSGRAAVLRFHFSEQARGFVEEARARAAHGRQAGAYESLIEQIEREIATREQRSRNLEGALRG